MKEDVSYLKIVVALLVGFVFFLLTDFTIILGFLIIPFVIYLLLDIKLKSNNIFWVVTVILWLPLLFLFSTLSFISFIVIIFSVIFLETSLHRHYTQEVTLTYLTFLMGILSLGSVVILQAFSIIPSFDSITAQVMNWYEGQLEEVQNMTNQTLDIDAIMTSINEFFMLIPSQFFVISFFVALYTILMVRVLTKQKESLWTYRPFSYWEFPRSIAYLYFFGMILTLFSSDFEQNTLAVLMNSMLIIEWILYIHGVAFIYYFLREKGLKTVWIVLILIVSIILRPVTIFVGFIEMLFKIRRRMEIGGK